MILTDAPDVAEKILDSIIEIEDNLVILVNEEGSILDINNQGLLILDTSKETITGTHLIELIPDKHKESFSSAFHSMLSSGNTEDIETGIKGTLDNNIIIKGKLIPIINRDKTSKIVFAGKDRSREKILNEKIDALNTRLIEAERLISIERERAFRRKSMLEELNRFKSEFISNISHELRTPLASIVGFSETIASDPDMADEMKLEFNRIILNEGKRLAKLINDLLDISKIEGGQLELQKSTFDFVNLTKDIIDAQKNIAEQKEISLIAELPETELLLNADRDKLHQVFTSLINNAIKFTDSKGRVRVIVRNLFKDIETIVSDTGLGIPEKDLPFIFQKFYKVNRPGSDIPGTGLGLVFVKQIVDLHKGFISVQSESGKGTTFVVKLPKNNFLI